MNLFDNSNAPKAHPRNFVRGDYVAWRNSSLVTDYPTASYTLTYNFRLEGEPARNFTVASSVDSEEYLFEISSATSANLSIGNYYWDLYVIRISDDERITVDQGELIVLASKETDSDDPRTFPRKMVAAIESAMLGRANNKQLDTLAYSLGVETSATRDPKQLRDWYDYMRTELNKANQKWRARNGLSHSGRIKVRF